MTSETRGAVLAALAATMGNLLQGWDNATIAGAVVYIKKEFKSEAQPTIEGLILSMSLIGATFITTFSGPLSDQLGRRPMLIISSLLYFLGGLVMFWSPNIYVLLLGRILDGLGVGLAVTLVPLYVSETAPPEIRGQLNTLPQLTGSCGMLASYCMIFSMSLMDSPSWRLMLGAVSIPSLVYFALTVLYLQESPRWLVSKGKMSEAKRVLRKLRGKEDVTCEMALLVEGLGTGGDTAIEEYVISAESGESPIDKNHVKLYGTEQGQSWIARPVTGQCALGMVSRGGSMASQSTKMMDPLVALFGSVHERIPATGSMRSMLFPNFGSMFNGNEGNHGATDDWDEENVQPDIQDPASDDDEAEESAKSPLLSRFPSNHQAGGGAEMVNNTGIGGGWQLAWKYSESRQGGKKQGEYKRVFLKEEGALASGRGLVFSLVGGPDVSEEPPQMVQAAALVSQSAIHIKDPKNQSPVALRKIKPSKEAMRGPSWSELFEPGVKHALIVGVGIQILQQFSGINGVLYYTPQILEQAGVGVLMSSLGLSPSSSSILISALTTLLMLPSIGLAMKLMDVSGRRFLLLNTIPILVATLILLAIANVVGMGQVPHALVSTISVVLYFCCFVMGFGPIPNILCSEIFPTRVRGLCIAICSLTFWFGDIVVTYSLPAMLSLIGLGGVFGIYALVCVVSWFFVFLKVPETKGMPLEVITEFFNLGAREAADAYAYEQDCD